MKDEDFSLDEFLSKGTRKPGRYLSYDDWYELGYHVRRGERHEIQDADGTPLFHETQVEHNQARYSEYEGMNHDMDDYGYDGPGAYDGEGFLW